MSVIAASVIGSAVIGGISANNNAKKAEASSNKAIAAEQASAEQQYQLGSRQADLADQQFAYDKERNSRLDNITEQVTAQQLASMQKNDALADDYANYQKNTFRPLEQGIVDEAQNYDTPEEQEKAAGQASATIQQSITAGRAATGRDMARMGVNPNSGRFASAADHITLQGALAEAGAENAARDKVRTVGAAKRMDAASLGRNLASNQATSAGLALNSGSSAVANNVAAIGSANQSAQTVSGIYGNAASTYGAAANTNGNIANQITNLYGIQAQQQAATMGAIGSGIGMYAAYKK